MTKDSIQFETQRFNLTDCHCERWDFMGDVNAEFNYCREDGFQLESILVTNCNFYRLDQSPERDLRCSTLAEAPDRFSQKEINYLEERISQDALERQIETL